MTVSRLEEVLEDVRADRFEGLDAQLVQKIFHLHFNSAPEEEALIKKTRNCLQEWIQDEVQGSQ